VELVRVVSSGDADREKPLSELGGVGVFTREVQDAVLDGRADLAVHSLKDLPTASHPLLVLAAAPERGPTADALISRNRVTFMQLPKNAKVATSSPRRKAQLLRRRPDLEIVEIRGNVETRIRKFESEGLDGLVLAVAGLSRLGLESWIAETLSDDVMLPAVGQGALGVECRVDDGETTELLRSIEDVATRTRVEAERALLATLQGGCRVPLGAATRIDQERLILRAVVLSLDGRRWVEDELAGEAADAVEIGRELGRRLLGRGAAELVADH
jgi:hydroxymethylbilane synthase